jgi:toxin-antitoxin system PIN domain toxin
MKSSLFPDVNVWLALTHSLHSHHGIAAEWFHSLPECSLFFCRFTQLSLLRLLTTSQVMGAELMSQRSAWQVYRKWYEDSRIEFLREPESQAFEILFHQLSLKPHAPPKLWADAYLAAFAKSSGLTVVTFDRSFPGAGSSSVTVLPARFLRT